MQENSVKVLNVAGPRASTEAKVGQFLMALLDEVLGVSKVSPARPRDQTEGRSVYQT